MVLFFCHCSHPTRIMCILAPSLQDWQITHAVDHYVPSDLLGIVNGGSFTTDWGLVRVFGIGMYTVIISTRFEVELRVVVVSGAGIRRVWTASSSIGIKRWIARVWIDSPILAPASFVLSGLRRIGSALRTIVSSAGLMPPLTHLASFILRSKVSQEGSLSSLIGFMFWNAFRHDLHVLHAEEPGEQPPLENKLEVRSQFKPSEPFLFECPHSLHLSSIFLWQ